MAARKRWRSLMSMVDVANEIPWITQADIVPVLIGGFFQEATDVEVVEAAKPATSDATH